MYNAAGRGVVLEGEVILASQAYTPQTPERTVASVPEVQNKGISQGEDMPGYGGVVRGISAVS